MRRGVALIALLGLACTDPVPVVPTAESHVDFFSFAQYGQPKLDFLIVIDSSPAMTVHHDRLAVSYRRFASVFEASGVADLHVGVVTSDLGGPGCWPGDGGRFRHRGLRDGEFLVDVLVSSAGSRFRNYEGTLADAIATLADVGTTGCPSAQPLAAMQRALEHPGFRRDDAYLAVLFVSATDDASPQSIDESVAFLTARSESEIAVGVLGGPGSDGCTSPITRLDAFARRMGRHTITSLCADDHLVVFDQISSFYTLFAGTGQCVAALADVDPVTPGIQHDCDVRDVRRDRTGTILDEAPLPECDTGQTNRPCWRVEDARDEWCLEFQVARIVPPFRWTRTEGQCVAE